MRTFSARTLLVAGMLPLIVAACATSAGASGARTVTEGASFSLKHDERVQLAGQGTLHYVRVTNDSRCPPGKQCVWAGDAEVVFEWTGASGTPETFSLHTGRGDRSKQLDGRTLTLESLERGATPAAQLRFDASPGA